VAMDRCRIRLSPVSLIPERSSLVADIPVNMRFRPNFLLAPRQRRSSTVFVGCSSPRSLGHQRGGGRWLLHHPSRKRSWSHHWYTFS
jgi:hypothetical protein